MTLNKANLRDLIAATRLIILLKLDSNRRFFAHVTLKFYGWPPKITRTPAFWRYPPPPHDYPHFWDILDPKSKQGKSEGFESCDRLIVRKHPIWVKIDYFFSRVTLKFDGWPSKTIGHLFYATSSLVHHFVAIGEFRLELQSGNAQSGSKSTIFLAVWPWNLTDDLEKQ